MIIEKSRELKPSEVYLLTMSPDAQSVKNLEGARIEIDAYIVYEDVDKKTGEIKELLAILTPEREVIATNSATFKNDFRKMWTLFQEMGEPLKAIEVISGTSKSGRKYYTCKYAE